MKKTTRKKKNISGKEMCQICKKPNFLDEHHIEGRDIPNPDHPSNVADICPNCHRRCHMGEIIVERWIMTTDGRELIWRIKGEDSFTGYDSVTHIIK